MEKRKEKEENTLVAFMHNRISGIEELKNRNERKKKSCHFKQMEGKTNGHSRPLHQGIVGPMPSSFGHQP